MPARETKELLATCVARLYEKDAFLIENDVHERSITHKLAEYLQDEVGEEWNVDCEYDLFGVDQRKELEGLAVACGGGRRTDGVFPDIIVHRRGTDRNFLVIEAKKPGNDTGCDEEKLRRFTANGGRFKYALGALLILGTVGQVRWFEAGAETREP